MYSVDPEVTAYLNRYRSHDKLEKDPNGLDLKTPGAKADDGKAPLTRGLLGYFPRACLAVASVSQRGAEKYSWKGWEKVPDGVNRYLDALGRHLAYREIHGEKDTDTGLDHLAQVAWNALAALELYLREQESNKVVSKKSLDYYGKWIPFTKKEMEYYQNHGLVPNDN